VYGERQNIGDRYRNVVGIFMNQILRGQPMTVFGDGTQTRAFSYVGDVAPLIAASIDVPAAYNQVFNVGADQPCSVNDLAAAVARAMGAAPRVEHLAARHEVPHAYCTHHKVARVFGPRPATALDAGLARMAAWVKDHGARESRPFKEIEVTRNLPPTWRG
jgi:UDP-glucose 4-epimerase